MADVTQLLSQSTTITLSVSKDALTPGISFRPTTKTVSVPALGKLSGNWPILDGKAVTANINHTNGVRSWVIATPPNPITWNPSDKDSDVTLSGGNLTATSSSNFGAVRANYGRISGKWYFEGVWTGRLAWLGLSDGDTSLNSELTGTYQWAIRGLKSSAFLQTSHDGSITNRGAYTYAAGHVFQVAVDLDAKKVWFGYDNTWQNSGDPANGTNPESSTVWYPFTSGYIYPAWAGNNADTTSSIDVKFKSSDFTYSPPTGFLAWDQSGAPTTVALTGVSVTVQKYGLFPTDPTIRFDSQVVTAQQGVVSSAIQVALTSIAISVAREPITTVISIKPDSTNVSLTLGSIDSGSGFSFSPALVGTAVTVSTGVLTPSVAIGATTAVPINPAVTTQSWTGSGGDTFSPWAGTSTGWAVQNNLVSYNGALHGAGETLYVHVSGNPSTLRQFGYLIDQVTRTKAWGHAPWAGTLWNSPGDAQACDAFFSGSGDHYFNDGTTVYDFAGGIGAWGGQFSLDPDGNMHFLHIRGYGLIAGRHNTTPDIHYHYQVSDIHESTISRMSFTVDGSHQFSMGVYGHTSNNALIFYPASNGADWVPAYRRRRGNTWGSEVKLTSFTGAASCNALHKKFCVVRSGYGDTIYVVYASGTTHIGVIVMDAESLTVTSHTLTATVATGSVFTSYSTDQNTATDRATRSIAEVVRLSGGTSVTQFLLGLQFVNLSWTSGTATAPTLTLKTGPSDSNLVGGWESLETKGDEVYHVVYKRTIDSSNFNGGTSKYDYVQSFKLYSNDATGTGSTWTLSSTIWTWTESMTLSQVLSSWSIWFSGYGEGKQTLLYSVPCIPYGYSHNEPIARLAWLDYWAGQAPYFTVSTKCRVGQVTVTIDLGPVSNLAGKTVTLNQGSLGVIANVAQALTGVTVTANKGLMFPGNADFPLAGTSVSLQAVGLTPVISQTLTGSGVTAQSGSATSVLAPPLTGNTISVLHGSLATTLTRALSGQLVSVSKGLLSHELRIALSGLQFPVQTGTFQLEFLNRLSGSAVTVASGILYPVIASPLLGKTVVVEKGQFGQEIYFKLSGQAVTIETGSFVVHSDVAITVSGVSTTGRVGVYPTDTNVRRATLKLMLWAQTEVEKLFTKNSKDKDTPLFNDTDEMQ